MIASPATGNEGLMDAKDQPPPIFISVTQNHNTGELHDKIFAKVKKLYLERYLYKAGYWHSYLAQQ
jgi:hypothetical protein